MRTVLGQSEDMSKTTKKIMDQFNRKLDAYVDAECSHCGHEELALKAAEKRIELCLFLSTALDQLVRKAEL